MACAPIAFKSIPAEVVSRIHKGIAAGIPNLIPF
jgi:hypothetical protein